MQMTLVQRIQHSEPGANEEDGMSVCLSVCLPVCVCACMCMHAHLCVFILLDYYSRGFSLLGEVSVSV